MSVIKIKYKKIKENFSNMRNINKEYEIIFDKNIKFGKKVPTSEYVGPGSFHFYIKEKGNSVLEWSKGLN